MCMRVCRWMGKKVKPKSNNFYCLLMIQFYNFNPVVNQNNNWCYAIVLGDAYALLYWWQLSMGKRKANYSQNNFWHLLGQFWIFGCNTHTHQLQPVFGVWFVVRLLFTRFNGCRFINICEIGNNSINFINMNSVQRQNRIMFYYIELLMQCAHCTRCTALNEHEQDTCVRRKRERDYCLFFLLS